MRIISSEGNFIVCSSLPVTISSDRHTFHLLPICLISSQPCLFFCPPHLSFHALVILTIVLFFSYVLCLLPLILHHLFVCPLCTILNPYSKVKADKTNWRTGFPFTTVGPRMSLWMMHPGSFCATVTTLHWSLGSPKINSIFVRKMEVAELNSLLPEEMLRMIFSFLPPKDLKSAVLVCKLWSRVEQAPGL